jgi:hypothetical protein
VRRGSFIDGGLWGALWPESQHLAEIAASASGFRKARVAISHASAAVLWGLPLFRHRPDRVEVTVIGLPRASTNAVVRRHLDQLPTADITAVHGIPCTSLDRTVFDVSRTLAAETSIACADAALRSLAVRNRMQDEALADAWREAMAERAAAARGARGLVRARQIIAIADGRAELPGESVSRLQLLRLGFARLTVQVPVAGPGATTYWVDIGIDDANAFGEFDGTTKYLDESLRAGSTIEEVMLREKQREDWIRGTTDRRFARWGIEHIRTPETLAARLASFGITPP